MYLEDLLTALLSLLRLSINSTLYYCSYCCLEGVYTSQINKSKYFISSTIKKLSMLLGEKLFLHETEVIVKVSI